MTFAIGGTAKLRRTVKPKPQAWIHVCTDKLAGGRELAGYMARCADCGTRRPNA